ncbi:MAG: LysM peptidoglycan-binding domain-containing protein [Terriglobia bacterium]
MVIDKKRSLLFVLISNLVCLPILSCKSTDTKSTAAKPPVDQAPQVPVQAALPKLPDSPVQHTSPIIQQKPQVDPVENLIQRSQAYFLQGERNLKAGFLEKAKKDFDESIEIILHSGIPLDQNERLERHYEGLLDKIFSYEMAALKAGDGFSEERVEAAPLDEIAAGELPMTFDPRSKSLAEETVRDYKHDLPLPINDSILRFIDYFQNRGHKTMEYGLQRSGRYRAMISKILAEEGVPQDLIFLCQAESGFRPLAYSRAKCKGMWQFAASRGAEYGLRQNWWIDERSDPEKSTRAAARHLHDLYMQFGDWLLAMAAYNTGPGNIERAIERTGYADYWELLKRKTLHPETADYVPIIIAMAIISKDPARYGFDVIPDPPIPQERVQIESAIDLRLVSETLDISLVEVQELNPHIKRMTTPRNDPEFNLYIPDGTKEKFLAEIESIPEDMRVTWRKHRVEEGETLSLLARRYHTTASAISQANGLSSDEKIQPGDKLIIPVTAGREGRERVVAQGSRVRYTVKRGDTLISIARNFDVSVSELRRWNHLSTKSTVRPGRVLILQTSAASIAAPSSRAQSKNSTQSAQSASNSLSGRSRVIHRVKKGETLYAIASNYGTSIESIRGWNNLSQGDDIKVGERLTIYVNR